MFSTLISAELVFKDGEFLSDFGVLLIGALVLLTVFIIVLLAVSTGRGYRSKPSKVTGWFLIVAMLLLIATVVALAVEFKSVFEVKEHNQAVAAEWLADEYGIVLTPQELDDLTLNARTNEAFPLQGVLLESGQKVELRLNPETQEFQLYYTDTKNLNPVER
jgi:uncharacterized membrane protein